MLGLGIGIGIGIGLEWGQGIDGVTTDPVRGREEAPPTERS